MGEETIRRGDEIGAIAIETHDGVRALDGAAWDALVGEASPFLEYGFLSTLEETGCMDTASGWTPIIVTARRHEPGGAEEDGRLLGALPMYLKTNSAGEFVFDWSWADAAQRAGLRYYPKAVAAVPYTPVTGARLLVDPGLDDSRADAIRRALVEAAIRIADDLELSSVHFNFLVPRDRRIFEELEIPVRAGIQYHWYNGRGAGPRGERTNRYGDFEEFLGRFRSKKRANIRRQRRKLAEKGVSTRVLEGDEINIAQLDRMFDYYRDTVEKFYWGRQYLTRDFFQAIGDALGPRLHMVVAEQDGEQFAGAFNLTKGDRLYGRYWGCTREVRHTHFEVCMYSAIEWCIERGIEVFEPGAGGEHKIDRGFEPTRTYSAHYIRDPSLDEAVTHFIRQERAHIDHQIDRMREESVFKDGPSMIPED
jgi:hypothetical protein